jgi:lipopolysaccharide export system ATP-binding protein
MLRCGLRPRFAGEVSETGVLDLLSLFRRRNATASRKPPADYEPIDLTTIGGAISTSYLDIASLPARPEKRRPKAPPRPPASQTSIPPQIVPPSAVTPAISPALPPFMPSPFEPVLPPQAAPAISPAAPPPFTPPPPQQSRPVRQPQGTNGSRSAPRPRRRSDGNGAASGDRKGLLAVHGVEKSFVGRKVVKGVSLHVRKGEAVGLLGPNGAGKTTVFYMITGLIKADQGRIDLDGADVTQLPMYQRARLGIGYLPQEASIFRGLTVEDNIRAVLEVVEPDSKRRARDLDSLLEEFNIARLRKTPAIALSGGERRRVEIARALATRPNYMLLDEPFAGIDPIAVGDIQSLVRHLTNRGIGVLITDHNVRETLGLTDRAYIIYSGEVLMEGRADEIVNNPEVRRLYLGEEFRL